MYTVTVCFRFATGVCGSERSALLSVLCGQMEQAYMAFCSDLSVQPEGAARGFSIRHSGMGHRIVLHIWIPAVAEQAYGCLRGFEKDGLVAVEK